MTMTHTSSPGLQAFFRTNIIDEKIQGYKEKNSARKDKCLKKEKCQSS